MLNIIALHAFEDNYIWLIRAPHNQQVAIVDPGDARPVLNYLQQHGLTPCAILVTHHHRDHTGGIAALRARYDIPVYGPDNKVIGGITHPLHHDEIISLPAIGAQFQIIATPGHTLDHLCYYGHGALFCGDTLFAAGCGRLFEGSPQQMQQSLEKIRNLPNDTWIYCAHEYTEANLAFARIAEPDNKDIQLREIATKKLRKVAHDTVPSLLSVEKQTNPFLRWDVPELVRNTEKFAGKTLRTPADALGAIRHWKDTLD